MKTTLIATVAAALAAVAAAGAATHGFQQLGALGNDKFSLAGTPVRCAISTGPYGAVMACSRPNEATVWVGAKGILVSTGLPSSRSFKVTTDLNWQGKPVSSTSNATTNDTSLASTLKKDLVTKLATTDPEITVGAVTCQINVGGTTGICFADVTDETASEKGTYTINVTYGTGGTFVWQIASASCTDLQTGLARTC